MPGNENLNSFSESELERYSEIFKHAAIGIACVALDGWFLDVNHALCGIIGYSKQALLAMTLDSFIHPDDRAKNSDLMQSLLDGETQQFRIDLRCVPKSGEPVWIMESVSLLRGQVGKSEAMAKPDCFIIAVKEITERKNIEQRLQTSQQFITRALNASLAGIYIYNIGQGRNDYINDRYSDITGYTLDDINAMVANDFAELFHPQDRESVEAHMREIAQAKEDEYFELEYRFRTRDGRWIWCLSRDVVFDRDASGKVYRIIGTFIDITERKISEQTLIDNEEKLRLLINFAPAALALFDTQMRYLAVSRRWLQDYGLDESNIIGRSHYDIFPEIPNRWKEAHRRGMEGETLQSKKDRFVRVDGRVQWIRWDLRPWHHADSSIGGIAIFTEDITEQVTAEQQLRRHSENLEQLVTERTQELESSLTELESFSYSVSHDLRTPLRSLDGFAQALEDEYAAVLDANGLDYLQRIRFNAQHMGHLIDDLLALSHISRQPLKTMAIDFSALVRNVAERHQLLQQDRKIEFRIAKNMQLNCDIHLVENLLDNIIGNACKFTAHKDVALIEVGQVTAGTERICYIRDNGIGFDMKYADKIFLPFHRLHRNKEYPGTGIGLASAQRIVQRHGGKLWVESAPAEGSCFFFSLGAQETSPVAILVGEEHEHEHET